MYWSEINAMFFVAFPIVTLDINHRVEETVNIRELKSKDDGNGYENVISK